MIQYEGGFGVPGSTFFIEISIPKGDFMASDKQFLNFFLDNLGNPSEITSKKMFGEYGVYYKGKICALICDNQLFIKPTDSGKNFIGNVVEAPPYPGAKNYFLIEDKLEDGEWLMELIKITFNELPEPKVKKRKIVKEK